MGIYLCCRIFYQFSYQFYDHEPILAYSTADRLECIIFSEISCGNSKIQVKSAITVALYRKVMKINTRSRQDIGVGKILNLMSSDTEKIMECSWQVHATWASALQLLCKIL